MKPAAATKGQIKRMKIEAKEVSEKGCNVEPPLFGDGKGDFLVPRCQVLYRPISEGFGYKMLQQMGWKEGEGLGKEEKGLATPCLGESRPLFFVLSLI